MLQPVLQRDQARCRAYGLVAALPTEGLELAGAFLRPSPTDDARIHCGLERTRPAGLRLVQIERTRRQLEGAVATAGGNHAVSSRRGRPCHRPLKAETRVRIPLMG